MENQTFSRLLTTTRPTNLSILHLTIELTRADGTLDIDAAAARQHEVELACAQAGGYITSTRRLAKALRWKLSPHLR